MARVHEKSVGVFGWSFESVRKGIDNLHLYWYSPGESAFEKTHTVSSLVMIFSIRSVFSQLLKVPVTNAEVAGYDHTKVTSVTSYEIFDHANQVLCIQVGIWHNG